MIVTKKYDEPPICEKEILRYLGIMDGDSKMNSLIAECLEELRSKLNYKLCYCELPVELEGGCCGFGSFSLQSKDLEKNLAGCDKVVFFAATIGVEIDRLIKKYGMLSPSKAVVFQAIGAERIEALCDMFCKEYAQEHQIILKPRFSPGYGDLELITQKIFFEILDCSKHIGVALNESLLMSPSKSVTAIAGIKRS